MDFMFEDEVDEVGSDVEAYCPKCKADTTHVVISKYEDEIRRVQCNPCGDVHSYRKPRGEVEEDVPEPVSARKRATARKATWEEFFAKHNEKNAKPYEFRERYKDNVMVTHPKFGVGFVSEVVSDSKVEITFKDARRILVHNRRDIPSLPLAAEGDGMPTPPKAPAAKPVATAKAVAPTAKPVTPPAKPVAQAKPSALAKPVVREETRRETKDAARDARESTVAKVKEPSGVKDSLAVRSGKDGAAKEPLAKEPAAKTAREAAAPKEPGREPKEPTVKEAAKAIKVPTKALPSKAKAVPVPAAAKGGKTETKHDAKHDAKKPVAKPVKAASAVKADKGKDKKPAAKTTAKPPAKAAAKPAKRR